MGAGVWGGRGIETRGMGTQGASVLGTRRGGWGVGAESRLPDPEGPCMVLCLTHSHQLLVQLLVLIKSLHVTSRELPGSVRWFGCVAGAAHLSTCSTHCTEDSAAHVLCDAASAPGSHVNQGGQCFVTATSGQTPNTSKDAMTQTEHWCCAE